MASTTFEKIKDACNLPSPTGVALRILQETQDESSTIARLTDIVESDPALSSRLLRLANSSMTGLPRQIASVHRAVALLGNRTITDLALGFSLVSNHREGKCSGFNYELFWSESLACAVASRHITDLVKGFAPDEVFTCGLLSQVGRLALATAYPQRYTEVLESYAGALDVTLTESPKGLAEIERSAFGIDHDELAAEMMADWHMPVVFFEAVRMQSRQDGAAETKEEAFPTRTVKLAQLLHLSGSISMILTQPTIYRDMLSTLTQEANRLDIAPCAFHDLFDTISSKWQDAGTIFSVQTRRVPSLTEIYALAQERRVVLRNGLESQSCQS